MLLDGRVGENLIVFGLIHIIIRKRYLNPWFGTTQGLDDTTLTVEAQLVFQDQIENFVYVCIITGATVFHLLMLQIYVNSEIKNIPCV